MRKKSFRDNFFVASFFLSVALAGCTSDASSRDCLSRLNSPISIALTTGKTLIESTRLHEGVYPANVTDTLIVLSGLLVENREIIPSLDALGFEAACTLVSRMPLVLSVTNNAEPSKSKFYELLNRQLDRVKLDIKLELFERNKRIAVTQKCEANL
jgi:hypothetical protein